MGFGTGGLNDIVASLCAYSEAGSEERSFEGVHFGKQHIQMTLQDGSQSEVGSMQAASSGHVSQKALAWRASVIPILPRASGTQQQGEAQLQPSALPSAGSQFPRFLQEPGIMARDPAHRCKVVGWQTSCAAARPG